MADLTENDVWEPVTRLELTDRVKGGAGGKSNEAPQQLVNRTRHVYLRTTPLADIAALKAIASPPAGLVRFVNRIGYYVFDDSPGGGESLPWVVSPTVGVGHWLHCLYGALNTAGGLPSLDGGAKLSASQVPNRLVSAGEAKLTADVTRSSSSFADVMTLSVTVEVGDLVDVVARSEVFNGGGGASSHRLVFDDGGNVTVGAEGQHQSTLAGPMPLSALYTVTTAGTLVIRVQQGGGTAPSVTTKGAAATTSPQSRVRALVFRP